MRIRFSHFTLCSVIACLTLSTLTTTVEANLNVGEPRTVRMIYFLPNDRPYRANVVQRMKDEILFIQTFYAQQMKAHGYGYTTFRMETDPQGEPIVHHVDGQYPNSHYINKHRDEVSGAVFGQITQTFDLYANIYVVILDNGRNVIGGRGGVGGRRGKNGGNVLVASIFKWKTLAHELGHAFGLEHDFNDGAYIMSYGTPSYGPESYGPERNRLSACSAEFLAVHPYFNPNTQLDNTRPTIELTSPRTYPAGAKNVSIKLKVSDSEGLHQVILCVKTSRNLHWARGFLEVKACHGLTGEKDTIVEFDYDGVIPTDDLTSLSIPTTHPIVIKAIDLNGNMRSANFVLEADSHESRTPDDAPRAWIRLEGRSITSVLSNYPDLVWLSLEHNYITDEAELVSGLSGLPYLKSLLLGNNSISDISLMASLTNLRELYLNSNDISDISAVASLINLTKLHLSSNDISDISVLAGLTNLEWLYFSNNSVSDISALVGLTDLKGLYLGDNLVSDISALIGLIKLKGLWLGGNSISDISALAGLTELTWLYLWHNSVSDISALAGLTNLTELALGGNRISDISVLAGLTHLEQLYLQENLILDVSALTGLSRLQSLDLSDNNISDISGMLDLIHLQALHLDNNSISDISTLANLTNLTTLSIHNNSITDLSPLVANIGLGDGSYVDVRLNPLNYASIYTHIPALQARGVRVDFFNRIPKKLVKVSGDKHASPSTSLPIIVEVQDEINYAFEGVPITFVVTEGNGTLSITATTTDKNGRAESVLTLDPNLGMTTIQVSAPIIEHPVIFIISTREGVIIPDSNLRSAIRDALGMVSDKQITPSEIATLTRLDVFNTGINDLTGLEFATNLVELNLAHNNISDILVLTGLTNLIELDLGGNHISDISAISGLTNLTELSLANNSISDISAVTHLANLIELDLGGNHISDISAVAGITNLEWLWLGDNSISDISAVVDLTNLTQLNLSDNSISDISALAGLTNLIELDLGGNHILDISALAGLTSLNILYLDQNLISDISAMANLTNLRNLYLSYNRILDISAVGNLTNLRNLYLSYNRILDISAVGNLTNLNRLNLAHNKISDISATTGLTNLTELDLDYNKISDIAALSDLTSLRDLRLRRTSTTPEFISDISPLVANTGLGNGDRIELRGNLLNYTSIYMHIPTLTSRGVTIQFDTLMKRLDKISGDNQHGVSFAPLSKPFMVRVWANHYVLEGAPVTFRVIAGRGILSVTNTTTDANGRAESTLTLGPNLGTHTVEVSVAGVEEPVTFNAISNELPTEYLWSVPSGINLIHVPLKVTAVDGVETTIKSISDLYDALGGTDAVNVLVTYDHSRRGWVSYASPQDRDTSADRPLTDDMGIIAIMTNPVTIRLQGTPLGTNENSTITLKQGTNLVGIPLRGSRITRISDLFTIDGIRDNVVAIIVSDGGEFKAVGRAGDDGDIPIIGGQSFLLNVRSDATVAISGSGWYNASGIQAAPLITIKGIEVGNTTPVLAMRGSIVDEGIRTNKVNFRVIVKNLSTGKAVATITANEGLPQSKGVGYQLTIVDMEAARAAQIGDILEISAQSTDPLIGIQPFQYTVTAEDVKRSQIQLDYLIAYEIPAEAELLANYPNPFNPETWISYRLAEDTNVVLTIYDSGGRVVRRLEVGHRKAAVYETRDKAIYWDGRNQLGERVSSGVYFYHLSVEDYSATKRMVILK